MATLELNTEQLATEFSVVENTLGVVEVSQNLDIVFENNELTLSETAQYLEVVSENPTLELTRADTNLTVVPGAVTLNQYFGGSGSQFTAVAGEAIGGQRAVYIANGEVFHADAANPSIAGQFVGVSTGAVSAGALVAIQTAGLMVDPGWEFVPGPVYVGTAGALVQTRPSAGWVASIGVAASPTQLVIHRTSSIEVA